MYIYFLHLQLAARQTPIIAILKILPYWLVNFLVRTGLLNRISSVFHLAATNHSEIMSRLTQNKDLQALSAYLFYGIGHSRLYKSFTTHSMFFLFNDLYSVTSGVPPKESSFLINALLLHHYKRGAYYPRGGSSEFAFHIIPVIQQAGGAVLVRAPVQRILLNQQGKVFGEKGGRRQILWLSMHSFSCSWKYAVRHSDSLYSLSNWDIS